MSNPVEDSWYRIYYSAISFFIEIVISYAALYVLYYIFFLMVLRYKKEFFGSRDIIKILMPILLLVQIIYPIIKIDILSLDIFKDYLMNIIISAIFSIVFLIGIYFIFLYLGYEKEYDREHSNSFSSTRREISLIYPFVIGVLFLASIIIYSSWQNLFAHLQIDIFGIILAYILWKIMDIVIDRFVKKDLYLNSKDREMPPPVIYFFIFLIVILTIVGTVFLVSLVSWQASFTYLTSSSLQGSISIDMNNRYLINDSPIYASIQMTGPDTGLLVKLKSEFNDRDYDAVIYLDKNNESMIYKNLNGRLLGEGRYSIIVNTTNMVIGNYVLSCTRQKYGSFKSERFYLANN